MVARHETLFELRFNDERDVFTILNAAGHMPLPPYIARPDEDADRELYQTVYSETRRGRRADRRPALRRTAAGGAAPRA